ncbi:hypothetical protein E2C01_043563 [Portunus trituberculatus]|uniref:Uncharacterized protein n=1 Tax=Portunus trituberculatus TaxID=210409 RepID=A0A5B7FQL8_PORTR|nr:hypothetical protein [Portunus trituberculatus]
MEDMRQRILRANPGSSDIVPCTALDTAMASQLPVIKVAAPPAPTQYQNLSKMRKQAQPFHEDKGGPHHPCTRGNPTLSSDGQRYCVDNRQHRTPNSSKLKFPRFTGRQVSKRE